MPRLPKIPAAQTMRVASLLLTATLSLSSARAQATPNAPALPLTEYGPAPALPAPEKSFFPSTHIAKAVGWPANETPRPHAGTVVKPYARELDHPRWLYVLPNGDVLVAETDGPYRPDDGNGVSRMVHRFVMRQAGSGSRASANRITLLRGVAPNGEARERHVFLQGLNSPFGMTLIGGDFYVADTDSVLRFPYHEGDTELRGPGKKVVDLPAGTINHHWTKSLIASPDGRRLFVGVGSNSNVAENGLDAEHDRAAVWEIDPASGAHRVFASGLRNPNGLAWEPHSGTLWVAVNERDEIGDHLPPDYMTGLREGAFYGWPFSYYGQHVDARVKPGNAALVRSATVPQYALGAHTASLGLCWSGGQALPLALREGMFVGQHGSWNRQPRSGYDVLFIPFDSGTPKGPPVVVLDGFLDAKGHARGRPVGVTIDKQGALLVADDVGNTVWRLTGASPPQASP